MSKESYDINRKSSGGMAKINKLLLLPRKYSFVFEPSFNSTPSQLF
jgi:hypothetical protein